MAPTRKAPATTTAAAAAQDDDWSQVEAHGAKSAQSHRATHVIVATLTQLLALFVYVYIYGYDVKDYGAYLAVVSAAAVYLLQFSYGNVSFKTSEKEKKELGYRFKSAAAESLFDEKVLGYTYFYNNAIFVGVLAFCAFFMFRTTTYPFNLVFGNLISAGIPAFVSTGSENRKSGSRR